MMPVMLDGIKIQTSNLLLDSNQFRFPRSKKRRIKKKWSKDKANYRTSPSRKLMHFRQTNTIICHPVMLREIEAAIKMRGVKPPEFKSPVFEEPEAKLRVNPMFGFRMPTCSRMSLINTTTC